MQYIFAPGCALMAYKPNLVERLKDWVESQYGPMETLQTCCFLSPKLEPGTCVVTPCATCTVNYLKGQKDCSSLFLLSAIAKSDNFPFPDYGGRPMSIQDTCSARSNLEYLEAVRTILKRLNITLVEPERSGATSKCCGQVFYGKLPEEKVAFQMKSRAQEMPCEDVVTYCASCIMAMTVGGKRPRYILDLLFGEPTSLPDSIKQWNSKLKNIRETAR